MYGNSGNWFLIGIGGVTCGGKTTLADSLSEYFPQSRVLRQDGYFYPFDDPRQIKLENVDDINHEILASLNMEKMLQDVMKIVNEESIHSANDITQNGNNAYSQNGNSAHSQNGGYQIDILKFQNKNVLIIEGFCILDNKPISDLCDLKFEIFLTKEECVRRRNLRVYARPDVPGYFEFCVWPEYLKHKEGLEGRKDIVFLDGTRSRSDLFNAVVGQMNTMLI